MNIKIKFLKVKVKSLAEESRIIRREEQRATWSNELREQLHLHRVNDVRDESRATHLAYGYLRGQPHRVIEPAGDIPAHIWKRVQAMVGKYRGEDDLPDLQDWRESGEAPAAAQAA